jgi:hypothetical protein
LKNVLLPLSPVTYHKRPLQTRKCAHCRTKFESNHKGRKYCCQSCNTLAWRARQLNTADPPGEAGGRKRCGPGHAGVLGAKRWDGGAGHGAGQGTTALWQQAMQGGYDLDVLRAEVPQLHQAVLAFHPGGEPMPPPDALRTATVPRVPLQLGPGDTVQAVRLAFHGQVLCHSPERHLLVWEATPGTNHRLTRAEQLPQIAAYAARQRPKSVPPVPPARAPEVALPAAAADTQLDR